MKKLLSLALLLLASASSQVMAQGSITGVFNESATGTTSATVFCDPRNGFANLTDLTWRLDAGVTTGLVTFRSGDTPYAVTSATSSSGTVVYFTNTGTSVAASEHVIVYDTSAGDYYLRYTSAAATTSVTVTQSISPALTTDDKIWSVIGSVSRAVPNVNSLTAAVNIWLPQGRPTAVTLEGNTTSCAISVNGVSSPYR